MVLSCSGFAALVATFLAFQVVLRALLELSVDWAYDRDRSVVVCIFDERIVEFIVEFGS